MVQARQRRYSERTRILLILLLTCSQAIAPALHAHLGGEHYNDGIHMHNGLATAHAVNAGANVESIDGRVIGVAVSLVSRAAKISSSVPRNVDATPGAALATNITDIAFPLSAGDLRPAVVSTIQPLRATPYFQPPRRGPPAA